MIPRVHKYRSYEEMKARDQPAMSGASISG